MGTNTTRTGVELNRYTPVSKAAEYRRCVWRADKTVYGHDPSLILKDARGQG